MNTTPYALYELHRHQILIAALSNPSLQLFSEAYLYAVANRMDPSFFDSGWKSEEQEDPFKSCYEVSYEEIKALLDHLDSLWLDKKTIPSFYEIEDAFGGRSKRMALINILRYCFLRPGFDPQFWKSILAPTKHPTEAGGICSPFNLSEVSFL